MVARIPNVEGLPSSWACALSDRDGFGSSYTASVVFTLSGATVSVGNTNATIKRAIGYR